jgi:hypothetical protein
MAISEKFFTDSLLSRYVMTSGPKIRILLLQKTFRCLYKIDPLEVKTLLQESNL